MFHGLVVWFFVPVLLLAGVWLLAFYLCIHLFLKFEGMQVSSWFVHVRDVGWFVSVPLCLSCSHSTVRYHDYKITVG